MKRMTAFFSGFFLVIGAVADLRTLCKLCACASLAMVFCVSPGSGFAAEVLQETRLQAGLSDAELQGVCSGYEARRDRAFEAMRGRRLKLKKRAPFLEAVSETVKFSFKSLWLNEQVAEANVALKRYGEMYIGDRKARNDGGSLYWYSDQVCRMVEFFGHSGTVAPGRVEPATEEKLLEVMWLYARENSKVDSLDSLYKLYAKGYPKDKAGALPISAETKRSQTWDVIVTENHHAMNIATLWHFTRLLSAATAYRDRKLDDGLSPREHYAAWTAYAKEYCRQRAKKGLFVEVADCTYNSFTLKGLYNFYDFSDDPELRELSGNLLTLYYATWAQEQLDGVRGGGKSRMNGLKNRRSTSTVDHAFWFYTGRGEPWTPSGWLCHVATSGYRLPPVVVDLALDVEGRGTYEILQRPLSLARSCTYTYLKKYHSLWHQPHYGLRTDVSGSLRYSYCTPDFIMGLQMVPARELTDWVKISSQSRWQGVIFSGDKDARIFVTCSDRKANVTYNEQWGVQRKGTMITQRMGDGKFSTGTEGTRVWFSDNGLSNRVEEAGWVFSEATGAYVAVRAARAGYAWETCLDTPDDGSLWSGSWMKLEDGYSPVIIEVARKTAFADYGSFRKTVAAQSVEWSGATLDYTGLNGDRFAFSADYSAAPTVNGEALVYEGEDIAFQSPFVISKWDSGVVTVRKGRRELVLNF